MTSNADYLGRLLSKLEQFRNEAGLERSEVERQLILGPGWVRSFETGEVIPSLDVVASLLGVYGKSLANLADGVDGAVPHIERSMYAVSAEGGVTVHFDYAQHDATYFLAGATVEEFDQVILTLRDGLARLRTLEEDETEEGDTEGEHAKSIKTDSVADAFLLAVKLWPDVNPSDIWWFVIYRAYCDPYNHPSSHARLDFVQSWKRTGGWALERILERHYGKLLRENGINLVIADGERKTRLLLKVDVGHRLEADKMDVLLTVGKDDDEKLIGVVHVKASFAERRTDDVPMSAALVAAGYISPLWTMDCKSSPNESPVNRGELGKTFSGEGNDNRSAKRIDIESDGYFSACFSYNSNTLPTPDGLESKAKVVVCDFKDPDDLFSRAIIAARLKVKEDLGL
ncbi:BsaWI family type II restriction enzyme [Luteimonas sp. 8-5]|uniref:helix-turn-helix domain-containing protein n=1 Tax=Luteimonas sp. 8-5 TaxID=3039387 RepID=UPI0024363D0E|nr:helix-turn-helix domain-containing protein [Luteimonas sp. 8-5]MDG6347396.1 BsaWI family type II restriction enzyme [Luteimonas sp. 8-5]